jgi:hypothetical protein
MQFLSFFNAFSICPRQFEFCCVTTFTKHFCKCKTTTRNKFLREKVTPHYTILSDFIAWANPREGSRQINYLTWPLLKYLKSLKQHEHNLLCFKKELRLSQAFWVGWCGITPASYSGSHGFKSWPGDRLSLLRCFVLFLVPPGKYRNSTLN